MHTRQKPLLGSGRLATLVPATCVALLLSAAPASRSVLVQEARLPFSCDVFHSGNTEVDLQKRFGAGNVTSALVPWGGAEGDVNPGTVLFGSTVGAKLEIFWSDRTGKRSPQWVSVRGKESRWHTPGGFTLGTDLRTLERLNGKPFRLIGYGSDVSGTILSWSAGALDAQNTKDCRVRLRVGPDWEAIDPATSQLINQLKGERDYSSGHPAMQALNPRVYELFLQYAHPPG